jgi:hypothetical protein
MAGGYFARKRDLPPPDHGAAMRKMAPQATSALSAALAGSAPSARTDALWLRTDAAGLFSVTIPEIAATTGRAERTLRRLASNGAKLGLTHRGAPVAWHYDAATDSVYFAAESHTSLFSRENAYRLLAVKGRPLTMEEPAVAAPKPALPNPADRFYDTRTFEQDNYALLYGIGDDVDADYWFWDYLYSGSVTSISQPLDVPAAAPSGTAQIRVVIRGGSNILPGDDHRVSVDINGVEVGEPIAWDGFEAVELVATFDQSILGPTNTLTLVTENGPGSIQLLDTVTLSYWRELQAENDQLWLHDLAPGTHTVSGFSTDDIKVVEAPTGRAKWRSDISVASAADGSYTVTFKADATADYLVAASSAVQPPRVEADYDANLAKRRNRADYLILAPRELAQTAQALKDYRNERFKRVEVVWLNEVYDEFSAGIVDAQAISDFFAVVSTQWRVAPQYVVLLGKGTLDHQDRLGYGDSLLPVVMTSTPWGATPSDNRYLDADGDGLANFSFGRIPVTDDAEGLAYVAKLQAYETAVGGAQSAVLVADNPDSAGNFHANSDATADVLKGYGYQVTKLYHPLQPVRTSLIQSATWNTAYVNYNGHGSSTQLGDGRENFLKTTDIAALSNDDLPIFAALTCSAGYTSTPAVGSVAADLVTNTWGGAVAALAPTGLSLDAEAHTMGQTFNSALIDDLQPIGDAFRQAQIDLSGQVSDFMLQMYQVYGDPAVYLR